MKNKKILIITGLIVFLPILIIAQPTILSVTMNPPNPGFGQQFTLTLTYCGQLYNSHTLAVAISTKNYFQNAQLSGVGQIFVLTSRGVDVPFASANGGEQIGYTAQTNPNGGVSDCTTCDGNSQARKFTKQYVLTVPPENMFPGCNNTQLYLLLGMKDSNMGESEWAGLTGGDCGSQDTYISPGWTIPIPSPTYTLVKRVEGVLQDVGDLVLFSIDYTYGNGPLTITDAIPNPPSGQFQLVAVGPLGMWSGPSIGCTTPGCGTITWTLPDRTGKPGYASGTVWFLLKMTQAIPNGTAINNTVQGNMSGNIKSHSTSLTVGQAAITLEKSIRTTQVGLNQTVTYFLEYNINGSKLVAYQPFDDIASNTYNSGSGPPPGWVFNPDGGEYGQWAVYDECNTGDRIIRGSIYPTTQKYPGLLYNYGSSFCTGTIVTDVMIDASYEGADSLIFIRNNNRPGTAQAVAYAVVLSVDNMIGTASASGKSALGFQRCSGSPASCIWPASPAIASPPFDIETGKWYRVKVEALSDYSFRAKVWRKGDPEPSGWLIQWTDPSPPAGSSCASDYWYTGIAEQGGDSGWTNDHYNNFIIYQPRTSANTSLYDTIPTGITYQNYAGVSSPATTSPVLKWNLGDISNAGGTYTWWGLVNTCTPVTNRCSMSGTGIQTINSNDVVFTPACISYISITKTANPNTVVAGGTATFVICYQNTGQLTTNVVVTDLIPSQVNPVTWNPNGGSVGGGQIVWTIPNVPVGGSGCVTWAGKVNWP